MVTAEVVTVESLAALHRAAAERFVEAAAQAVAGRGVFRVALSGGTTPKGMFAQLATDRTLRDRVAWDAVHFFWGDERHVGPDHPDSNYGMARASLLDPLAIDPGHVHRIRGELDDAAAAARDYEQSIRAAFSAAAGALPRFDLILLGLGADGHTASLFPESAALQELQRLVVANRVPRLETDRITMTAPLLNGAAEILMLVAGTDKAQALMHVLQGPYDPVRLPAQLIRPADGRLTWLTDRAAASRLAG